MDNSPLEFPCDYPVKVMGRNAPGFRERMLEVLASEPVAVTALRVEERLSRDGAYVSLTCMVAVASREQLDRIYRELHATGLVLFAL